MSEELESGSAKALRELADELGTVTGEMVACGIVVQAWRDPMEPLHHRLYDHEMAYINIATTMAVARACGAESVEWPSVWATLRDPDRVILPRRTAKQVAGRDWKPLKTAITRALQAVEKYPPVVLAAWATAICPKWWGMPLYGAQVEGLIAAGRVTRWQSTREALAHALVHEPISVPLEVWEEIVGGGGLGWLDDDY